MDDREFILQKNESLTAAVYRMVLAGDVSGIRPGQFVNVLLPGFYLRRPISVCDAENGELTLIYKVVGHGTAQMAALSPGAALKLLCPLGNGYDPTKAGDAPLLLGGGVGVPPLYYLAKELRREGKAVSVVLGFNTKNEVFYEEAFRDLGCAVTVTTADGSYGTRGFVTDALPDRISFFYTCGPLPMLKAVCKAVGAPGEVSLEERMGCGFGACVGCTHKTASGFQRVCKEGPVFRKEVLLWED